MTRTKLFLQNLLFTCLCVYIQAQTDADVPEQKTPGVSFTAGIDAATAYNLRGMTCNKGFVLQPYLNVRSKWFTYLLWTNYNLQSDDNGLGHFKSSEFTETDHLFTFLLLPVKFVDLDATLGIYTYPYLGWESDKEMQIGISKTFYSYLTPSVRICYMIDGSMEKNLYVEFGVKGNKKINEQLSFEYLLRASWEKQGYVSESPSGMRELLATTGLTWMLNKSVGFVGKLNYSEQLNPRILSDKLYDVRFFGSIGTVVNF
ncbi:MAG: hypothetical protein LBP34_02650 [Flavobacteriaceae bacterium]|jgi:hypothetical protein|nr:hypothetical protein [Flavobacteriaceae bacterium]